MLRLSIPVSLVLSLLAVPAFAETAAETQARLDAEKQARIQAAVDACDEGAAVPLDPEAVAPPVQFSDLVLDLDPDKLTDLADACHTAMEGAPELKRLRLQYIRTAIAARDGDLYRFAAEVRAMAAAGSAEANNLLDALYSFSPPGGEPIISREEAVAGLTAAAEAGLQDAIAVLMRQYRYGPRVRRDDRSAAHYAEALMNLKQQGVKFKGATEDQARAAGRVMLGEVLVVGEGFDDADRARGFAIVEELYKGGNADLFPAYVTAFRYGRGTAADPAKARQLAEDAVKAGNARAVALLADMLANGEGGAADGKRAIALLTSDLGRGSRYSNPVLAGLYLDNRFTGPRPRDAALLLANAPSIDDLIKAAPLLADYNVRIKYPPFYAMRMAAAAEVGEPGAAMAFARLKMSNHTDFGNDMAGARAILARLAADGDREATLLLAETSYGDLGTSSFNPRLRDGLMSEDAIRKAIDEGVADGLASAFRVKAKFERVGVIYPQDDAAATQSLIKAAEGGDIEAMLLLGDAYDDGLGIAENHRERLRWWRAAAAKGSLTAREKLAGAFTFDTFDKLMTLREGVTEKIIAYNNADDGGPFAVMSLSGLYNGGRARDAGPAALAAATMDGFRAAPAGLDDKRLVPLMRALPDEIRVEIEKTLKTEGFYQGTPSGNFGPDVRAGLAAWVEAKGPLPDDTADDGKAAAPAVTSDALPDDVYNRVRERIYTELSKATAQTPEADRVALVGRLNLLARYGDMGSRWVMVKNWHQAQLIHDGVTPEEVTRYGIDILVSRPEGIEKADFEFIFDLTQMATDRKSKQFGKAFVDAVRDDPRLQDPLTLGSIMQQLIFAPGACDAILSTLTEAGVADLGDDGCGETAKTVLAGFAKVMGPSGTDAAARAEAATEIARLDAEAN